MMSKSLAIAFVLVATSSIAHAQAPGVVAAQPVPAPEPHYYVSADLTSGVGSGIDWLYGGAGVDGGLRVSRVWWLHARVDTVGRIGYGTTNDLTLMSPQGGIVDSRIGAEARGCHSSSLCMYGGADIGYRVGSSGRGEDLTGVLVALRGGLDVGSANLRFRPGVELLGAAAPGVSRGDAPYPLLPGVGLTMAVAYQF
jgi:hypothetical protein